MCLSAALDAIDKMPQLTFDEIVEKCVEMNEARPFREGNGRATRILLDDILKRELRRVADWSRTDGENYLLAMERSPVRDTEIKALLTGALADRVDDRQVYLRGIDASYRYEGYSTYTMDDLDEEGAESRSARRGTPATDTSTVDAIKR